MSNELKIMLVVLLIIAALIAYGQFSYYGEQVKKCGLGDVVTPGFSFRMENNICFMRIPVQDSGVWIKYDHFLDGHKDQ